MMSGLDFENGRYKLDRARFRNPTIGRWISKDPIGFNANDTNLYRYVGNDATNLRDPSGLQADEKDKPKTPPNVEEHWPEDVTQCVTDIFNAPGVLDELKDQAKKSHDDKECGGFICEDKDGKQVVHTSDPSGNSENTAIKEVVGEHPPLQDDKGRTKRDKNGRALPDKNLKNKYGWHTHTEGYDGFPSDLDERLAKQSQMPEIVIKYYTRMRAGKSEDTWMFHIVGKDGKSYEWRQGD